MALLYLSCRLLKVVHISRNELFSFPLQRNHVKVCRPPCVLDEHKDLCSGLTFLEKIVIISVTIVFSWWTSSFISEMVIFIITRSFLNFTRIFSGTRVGSSSFLRLIKRSTLRRFHSFLNEFVVFLFGFWMFISISKK